MCLGVLSVRPRCTLQSHQDTDDNSCLPLASNPIVLSASSLITTSPWFDICKYPALGHPLAASGARILNNLTHNLRRLNKRYGIGAACIGGGQGIAVVLERC